LRIELGCTQMDRQEAVKLRAGSVVPLDNSVAGPVDIYADGRLIGRGDVLAVDGKFGVRIVELTNV
jgi:flagellar motor switch protein FliN/FliY